MRECKEIDLMQLSKHELDNYTFNTVMEKMFYHDWKNNYDNYSLELIFSPKCNQKCAYCYLNKDNQGVYSSQDFLIRESLENTKLVLQWLSFNDMVPSQIDIFSGELFAQEAGYELLETIITFYEENPECKKPRIFLIPTNGTFVMNDMLVQRVKSYIERFQKAGTRLGLSFSIDGLYASKITRQYKQDLDYDLRDSYTNDEEFYEKAFKFMGETGNLPHPMIAPENIHVWKENFLWYEAIMEKYNVQFDLLYMLEVRNPNWTPKKIELYQELIVFILEHMREKYNNDERFISWLTTFSDEFKCLGFNFLSNITYSENPETTCTFGKHLMLRTSDLKMFPCHRLVYPEFEIGHFVPDEKEVLKFDTKNPELGISILSFNPKKQNICETCIVRDLCVNQCYGSCYETVGDMFTPIPSVCNLTYAKVKTILTTIKRMGLLNSYLLHIHNDKVTKNLVTFLNREIGEEGNDF